MVRFFEQTFQALGSENSIQLYVDHESTAERLFADAYAEVKRIEIKFSRFRPESVLSRINAAAGSSERVPVDEELAALLDYGNAAFQTSNGLFDLTSGVLSRLWNFRKREIPSPETLEKTKALVGWNKVEWKNRAIRLPQKGMELDLGGIGKEYAVDRVSGLLLQAGVRHGLVNFGGDLRILGARPDGSPWNIGVVHPRLQGDILAGVSTRAGSIATSGDYERYFELDGKRYCHIINPKTGFPVEGVQAVTVFADSCLIAGTAATIAMLSGPKAGKRYLQELSLPSFMLDAEGTLTPFALDTH